MPESQDTVWLTQEAFDKLTQELAYLKGEGRTIISNKIADARSEGDLSENGTVGGPFRRRAPTMPPVRSRGRPRPASVSWSRCCATLRWAKPRPLRTRSCLVPR